MSIRNFSIIAHIDHGKTTLTDRLLLKTGTISERDFRERLMDSNPIEQERGITIKMAPVRMQYKDHVLNLIDTPGHVDFSYEVSRSLQAVEGAILLVDATQGVQAQTLSHFYKAKEQELVIIPVLNKIDLENAQVDESTLEMMELFGFSEDEFLHVSAKTGMGVDELLSDLVSRVPPPRGKAGDPLRGLVFSSQFDQHRGVVVYIRVVDGELRKGDNVTFAASGAKFEVPEVGFFLPNQTPSDRLRAGEVGYVATGLKDISLAHVGDTLTHDPRDKNLIPLVGYQPPQLMVFMDYYPVDGGDYSTLLEAMEKLKLHDSAIQFSPTHSSALGNGLRVGFLGILHAEIVQERLEREFDLSLIATAPSVRYLVEMSNGDEIEVHNPADLPEPHQIKQIKEPVARATIYTPKDYVGAVMQLSEEHRGELVDMVYIGSRAQLTYLLPLSEIIVSYFDELKSVSSGFASLEYTVEDYKVEDVVKLSVLINHEPIEALSQMVVKSKAEAMGRFMVDRLKEVIPRQLFEIPIQAAIGGKIIARSTIRAFRKDVTAKLYGGDISRRKKLLEKQKKGKERRKQFGKVEIPQEAFFAVLKRG